MSRLRSSACLLLLAVLGCEKPVTPPPPPPPAPPAPPAVAQAPMPPADPLKAIPDIPWKMVDKTKAMAENPKLAVTQNTIVIGDPVSVAGSAYFSIASQATVQSLIHSIRLHEAEHGKRPTFDEFNGMLKMYNVPLKGLKPWQVYAYDDQDGTITILEDPDIKAEAYKKVGLELKE